MSQDFNPVSAHQKNLPSHIHPQAIISVQGKIGKNKELSGNMLVCRNTETCAVNFDGRESIGEDLEYFWDFGSFEYE